MALSGVRDSGETARDIVTAALEKLFILEGGETPEPEDMVKGIKALRRMIRTWAVDDVRLWLHEEQEVALVSGKSQYTLSPRALDVEYAFRRSSGNDTPLTRFERLEYQRLPNKSTAGAPYAYWPDRQLGQTVVTFYPVPNAATDTVHFTVKRQIQDVTDITDEIEFPPEWSECLVYNLALRLAPDFSATPANEVRVMAIELYELMKGQDRAESVRFAPMRRYR